MAAGRALAALLAALLAMLLAASAQLIPREGTDRDRDGDGPAPPTLDSVPRTLGSVPPIPTPVPITPTRGSAAIPTPPTLRGCPGRRDPPVRG